MTRGWLVAIATIAGGCVSPAQVFTCDTSDQCTVGGTCQPNGYCSFADPACPSGQSYGDGAGGGLSGVCVGDEPPIDAPDRIDSPPGTPDGPPDATPDADDCATPFVSSLHGCHAFLTPTAANHDGARTMCQALGADLPVVQTIEESTYIAAMAGLTAADRVHIGLDFRTGTWTWVDGTTLTFTNWEVGEPSLGENVAVIRPTATGSWAGRLDTDVFFVACEK